MYTHNRLKKFFQREGIGLNKAEDAANNEDDAEIRDATDNGIQEEVDEETDNEQDD